MGEGLIYIQIPDLLSLATLSFLLEQNRKNEETMHVTFTMINRDKKNRVSTT